MSTDDKARAARAWLYVAGTKVRELAELLDPEELDEVFADIILESGLAEGALNYFEPGDPIRVALERKLAEEGTGAGGET